MGIIGVSKSRRGRGLRAPRMWPLVLMAALVPLSSGCGSNEREPSTSLSFGGQSAGLVSKGRADLAGLTSPHRAVASAKQPSFGEPIRPNQVAAEPVPDLVGRPTSARTWESLTQKAQINGLLPVIVALKLTARPEGALSTPELALQRANTVAKSNAVLAELRGRGIRRVKAFDEVPFLAMHVTPQALEALRRSPNVIGVSEDRELPLQATVNTETNPPLVDYWDVGRAQMRTSWTKGYDGRGWTVGILDSGVDSAHPWLTGKVVSEACYATYQIGSSSGYCPNGLWTQTGPGSARPCSFIACDHGTHVAQTAAGSWSGVAYRANIIAVQVFHRSSDGKARSFTSDQVWGLKYIYDLRTTYNIAAVNLSIGSDIAYAGYCDNLDSNNSLFYSYVATLRSVGIATVISSGNGNYRDGLSSPACISNVVSTGNSTLAPGNADAIFGNVSYGSNSANFLSLVAPGTHILSAVPNSQRSYKTGTSMAAPHVTGAFAVLKQLRPSASVTSMLAALQASGTRIYDGRNGITKSRINVWDSVVYLHNH